MSTLKCSCSLLVGFVAGMFLISARPLAAEVRYPNSGVCAGMAAEDLKPCMQTFVEDASLLGLVVLVDRANFPLQLHGVGRYRTDSIFQIMSMSKPFVSLGILILVERGKIPSIDSKIASVAGLADFPYRDLTFRQILTHTSGMWYKRQAQPGVWWGIAPHLTNRLDKAPNVTARDKTLSFVANHYADTDLYPLESGAPQYRYSNVGYILLGSIIERLSGKSLSRFMATEIFEKLGMRDTFYFPAAASPGQRARIVALDRRKPDPPDYNHYDEMRPGWAYVSPEGGLYSTAADLRMFLSLFRHHGQVPGRPRVVQPASISLMMEDQVPDIRVGTSGCGARIGRTLAFSVVLADGCPSAAVLTSGTIYHNGRFSTEFWYSPSRDEIGVSLYQRVESDTARFQPRPVLYDLIARIRRP